MTFLGSLGIETETVEHPAAFTIEELMPHVGHLGGAVAKNLFLRDKKKRFWLLSCLHDRKLNLNDVARAVGTKDLRFGDEAVLQERLGVRQGSVNAYALMEDAEARSITFAVDSALVDGSHDRVFFHPMVNTASTAIKTDDLKKFLKAVNHGEYKTVKF